MWEENDDPTLEGCYEYDETEYYQNNDTKEQVGSESNQNPQAILLFNHQW